MLKETTGAFDGARTHDLHITSQACNPVRHAAPWKYDDGDDDDANDDDNYNKDYDNTDED